MIRQTSLTLVLLAALCNGCASSSTVADRMPTAAAVVASSISDAEEELAAVRGEIRSSLLPDDVRVILEGVASEIQRGIEDSRTHLAAAQAGPDVAALRRAGDEAVVAFRAIASLRTMHLVAVAAAQ